MYFLRFRIRPAPVVVLVPVAVIAPVVGNESGMSYEIALVIVDILIQAALFRFPGSRAIWILVTAFYASHLSPSAESEVGSLAEGRGHRLQAAARWPMSSCWRLSRTSRVHSGQRITVVVRANGETLSFVAKYFSVFSVNSSVPAALFLR